MKKKFLILVILLSLISLAVYASLIYGKEDEDLHCTQEYIEEGGGYYHVYCEATVNVKSFPYYQKFTFK